MSLSDIKHALRKFEFPNSAKEALTKIEQLLIGRSAPTSKQVDVTIEIISEFVFCETERRSGRRLNSLQELQLIDVICEYLSACTNETTKNTIFLSLFGGMESQRRLKILSILASMAVSANSAPVLLAVGVWLQQMGCSSPQSLQLIENIIRDHFLLNTSNQITLRSLANSTPQFVANFITAVVELYMCGGVEQDIKMPPRNLLEVITSWVYLNPNVCMSAQLNPPALPTGSIPMAAVTPLGGLIRWCALASLYISEDNEMVDVDLPFKKIKIEDETHLGVKKSNSKILTESELYTKLHLGVLHSLRAGKRSHGPPTAVNGQQIISWMCVIQKYAHQLMLKGIKPQNDVKLQDCLDRLGQAVQVALANGCIYGNINNLLAALETLPENRLLKIIIKTHQKVIC